ncbi:late histone H2B.L4-like [Ochotona curzoniae]|uniref:late histone H2B.L4-like n=1 Tax=Ochotona curzoniae TaxID=130825 RepID=UPI001B348230|nr:late histone H2B.L4-like [Ochotona curzoniae]
MAEPSSPSPAEEPLVCQDPEKASSPNGKEEKPRPRHRRRRRSRLGTSQQPTFAIYFPKVLKEVHAGLSLSKEAKAVLDCFVRDLFERIADEAASLVRNKKGSTLTYRDIQSAIRLVLPSQLYKYADSQANKALIKFISSK